MLFVHILLGGAFPKRYRANYGVIAVIRKVPILGRHTIACRMKAWAEDVIPLLYCVVI
jgi:hypothetical protein